MHVANGMAGVPAFDRLRYFYGQLLGAHDLQAEQRYFREKMKLHNRCLHGHGVVCGLGVAVKEPEPDCGPPKGGSDPAAATLTLAPGAALDCAGNDLVVREPTPFRPWKYLSREDRDKVEGGADVLYVSLCHREEPREPARPVLADPCGAVEPCTWGRVRDVACITVTASEPDTPSRCRTCCGGGECCCVLLARITDFKKGEPIDPSAVDTTVQREVGLFVPTTIAGVSWSHGGRYSPEQAGRILGRGGYTDGLEIRFTAGVRVADLRPGVVDIFVIEGGKGRAGNIYNVFGDFVGLPSSDTTTSLHYRMTTQETLQTGDRVLIRLRSALVLDDCCLPVHGANPGGRVALLPEYEEFRSGTAPEGCEQPTFRSNAALCGPSDLESWFWVDEEKTK
jgi:hypothetical protein